LALSIPGASREWIIDFSRSMAPYLKEVPSRTRSTIDIHFVQQASAKGIVQGWLLKVDDATWLSKRHYQSYLDLNLCRLLHTVIRGEPVPKKVAGQWVKSAYSPWTELTEEAERCMYAVEMTREEDTEPSRDSWSTG